jgi:hypothetical protein
MSEKAILEQCKKVHCASDPEDFELYGKIPATKQSKHGLHKWASNRAKPGLEKYHEALAHFTNTGTTGSDLTDTLNVEGTAEWNVKYRFKQMTRSSPALTWKCCALQRPATILGSLEAGISQQDCRAEGHGPHLQLGHRDQSGQWRNLHFCVFQTTID